MSKSTVTTKPRSAALALDHGTMAGEVAAAKRKIIDALDAAKVTVEEVAGKYTTVANAHAREADAHATTASEAERRESELVAMNLSNLRQLEREKDTEIEKLKSDLAETKIKLATAEGKIRKIEQQLA